jgi:uncharacterized membrane protein HdeD (DUF308 family)
MTTNGESVHVQLNACYERAFKGPRQNFAICGVLLALIGIGALAVPLLLNNILIAIGVILICAGFLSCLTLVRVPPRTEIQLSAFVLLALSAGIYLLQSLEIASGNVGFVFAAYFGLSGLVTFFSLGPLGWEAGAHSNWLPASGMMSFNLAIISLSGLPAAFIWTFSMFLGLHLIFHGGALFVASLTTID